jgi:glutamyl-tRNA synthetase
VSPPPTDDLAFTSRLAPPPRGRFAPSPTGELHLGNAFAALAAWLSVRARGGAMLMRIEDLDRPRVRPGAARVILRDLEWLGLDWDEGPDRGGPHGPYLQSERAPLYDSAFRKIVESGRAYRCFCSRRDIAAAASAPQAPGDEIRYPGTCRRLSRGEVATRLEQGLKAAWRFRVEPDDRAGFVDLVRGPWGNGGASLPGDFVIRRADGLSAYQHAVVVDDAAMAVSEVVRGDDLLASTQRQVLLYRVLGLQPPAFGHVPLLLGADGERLCKRHAGTSVREMRESGRSPEEVIGMLAHWLGIRPAPVPARASELVEGFSLSRVVHAPSGIRIH